jgi:hypothetical protein
MDDCQRKGTIFSSVCKYVHTAMRYICEKKKKKKTMWPPLWPLLLGAYRTPVVVTGLSSWFWFGFWVL